MTADTLTPTRPGAPRARLDAIDGLRAFAAMWVVLFHIRAVSHARIPVPGLDQLIRSGSTGVSLFLVLSGFCLFLPFAGGRLERFEMGDFMRRRSMRLLPAYIASLLVIVAVHLIAAGRWGLMPLSGWALPAQLGTHLTLTHQLFPATFYGLNGAYWSLGLEWELYLTLPLLIFSARRLGLARTVVAVIAASATYRLALEAFLHVGVIDPHGPWATVVLPNLFLGRWAEFALGMWAASLYVTGRAVVWARRLVWVALALVPVGFAMAGRPLGHLVFGLIFFSLVCTVLDDAHPVARLFSWRPLVALGVMSYSLYLVHQPLLAVGGSVLRGHGWSPIAVLVALVAAIPVIVLVARVLFVTVERRTISRRPTSAKASRPAVSASPRPSPGVAR
jgi:peptidoglycan/LPS O-acetylase OafA/YrhL